MSNDIEENEVARHQERLSDAVKSGGGCAEVWDAAQETRNGNRRSFLTKVVASLFAGTSIASAPATASVPRDPDKQTDPLSPDEKQTLVREALRDSRVGSLQKELGDLGLSPDLDAVEGYRSTFRSREWKFIRIPFSGPESSTLRLSENGDEVRIGGIIWNTLDEVDPHGFVTTNEVDHEADTDLVATELRDIGVPIDDLETVPVVVRHTTFWAGTAEEFEEGTSSLVFPVATGNQVTADGCACNSLFANPLTACAPCGIYDTSCIADLANTYALEVVACGTCAFSAGWLTWACAACIATIIEEDEFGFFCCPCEACDGIIVC